MYDNLQTEAPGLTLLPRGAELLQFAKRQILAHPERFDMNNWDDATLHLDKTDYPLCGTLQCIGGHMAAELVFRARTDEDIRRLILSSADDDPALHFWCYGPPQPASGDWKHSLLWRLFYDYSYGYEMTPNGAAERIDCVLRAHGYLPPIAAAAPADQTTPEVACAAV